MAENFVPALESLSSLGFEERIWDVPGILPGCPGPLGVFKKFVQKNFVRIFRSLFSFEIISVRMETQASAWNRFWRDFLEVRGILRQTS